MKFHIKKIAFLSLFALLSIQIFGFGRKAPQIVVGHIKYFGNTPFEFAGFETVDGYIYTLNVAENLSFTIEELCTEQGNMLELTGEIDKSQKNSLNVLKDGIFIVDSWKRL